MTLEPEFPSNPRMRVGEADRERVAELLNQAAAERRLELDEYQRRLDAAYAAVTYAELRPLVEDLPAPAPAHPRIGGVPGSRTSVAIASGAWRKGTWVVPRAHRSIAVWGRAEIDLREACFAEREVVITALALLGGVEILVPEDVTVRIEGVGVLGAFYGDAQEAGPDAPVVRIRGLATWGAVHIRRVPR
ncbi:DUF1707 domain-containing protein [Microbispora sp. NPDC088329]|uniref:DUF1707 SHOCT-like domain-containing protein n=1 Tax=Microbispora sp. NPDC088329 TaxID=3154869 RepID=UPI0034446A7D